MRSEEHTSELQSLTNLVCRLLLEKKKHTRHATTLLAPDAHPARPARGRATVGAAARPEPPAKPCRLGVSRPLVDCCLFFNDTATTEIYTLSLHDALPI